MRRWIFLAVSDSIPFLTLMTCLTLSPPIFCTSPLSRKRTSTLRLVSLLRRISSTCTSWNSASPSRVISLSLSSTAAAVPLKSKRVAISLAVFSTAFLTSGRLGSQTVSKDGMEAPAATNRIDSAAQWRTACECDNSPMIVEHNVPLQQHNSFGIVARAQHLARIASEADVAAVLADAQWRSAPKFVLGGG